MDFKEAKKLLFSENAKLDFKTADEIIKLMNTPRMLKCLINADKDKIFLNQYKEFNEKELKHDFERSEIACFSHKVVEKFFETRDDAIMFEFVQTLHVNLFKKAQEHLVFQWPYFTPSIINYTTFAVLETLILNRFFVFDFDSDKNGLIFEKLINLTEDDNLFKELLFINSFNVEAFADRIEYCPSIEPVDFARMSAYSMHYINGFTDFYGSFRKLFISYIEFGMIAQEYFTKKLQNARGVFYS